MTLPPRLQENPNLSLPPERFYWAVLDMSAINSHRPTAHQMGYLFESVLPLPIEQVQAVYARVSTTGQCIACGIARDKLHHELAVASGEIVTLAPMSLPTFVNDQLGDAASTVNPQDLNLLVRDFEPKVIRNLNRRSFIQIAVAVAAVAVVVVGGLERRTHHFSVATDAVRTAQRDALDQVLAGAPTDTRSSGGAVAGGGGQPAELRLTAELRLLRQTRQRPTAPELTERDSSVVLAAVLAQWPRDLHFQTESLLVNSTGITIRGMAPTSADVQSLAEALQHVGGGRGRGGGLAGAAAAGQCRS